jgi:hypothetical protein
MEAFSAGLATDEGDTVSSFARPEAGNLAL